MANERRPAIGRRSTNPADIINTRSKTCEIMPTNNRQQVKSSSEYQSREFLYQSLRNPRARKRNSTPSANSGIARIAAGETLKTLSIFSIADVAAPVGSLAGGKAAAPKQ